METNENNKTYVLTINYSDERDCDNLEGLTKSVAKTLANSLTTQLEAKKECATIEVDENDFYIFRLINMKDVSSIDVDEE